MSSNNNVALFKYDSKRKIRTWKASLNPQPDAKGYLIITIEHGQLDGKMQTKTREVKSGKNKGKSNETTLLEQAELELGYLYQKQFDDGYVKDIADYQEPRKPVLAHKYKEKKHTLRFGSKKYLASRKLNGIRCMIHCNDGEVKHFESRSGKLFKFFKHIAKDVVDGVGALASRMYDGELYHPEIPFEIICSLVNSDEYTEVTDPVTGKVWKTEDILFYCYDSPNLDDLEMSYTERFNNTITSYGSFIKLENYEIETEEQLIELALQWIEEGEEGLMLRDPDAAYEFGKRSIYLLKYKVMEQAEFLIKKIYLAENDATKVMVTVYNHFATDPKYSEFDCALKGNKDDNLEYYVNREDHEDKSWMTIDFQVLSAYNVPLFPVGITIRKGSVVDGVFVPEV